MDLSKKFVGFDTWFGDSRVVVFHHRDPVTKSVHLGVQAHWDAFL